MALVFSVGLLQVQGLRNNLAKWLLPLPFSLGKLGKWYSTLLELSHRAPGLLGAFHVFNSFLPSLHQILRPAGRGRRVTVLSLNNCELVLAWQMSSLSWESGLGLPPTPCTRAELPWSLSSWPGVPSTSPAGIPPTQGPVEAKGITPVLDPGKRSM